KDSLLIKFTAACGPVVYQGSQFPEEYQQNVFVCEPQANLIKRDILNFSEIKTTAKQAWDDKEFISSSDEGFRPVNLFNGPDGALYVVDMHRGIMEYGAFSTPYYNEGIARKKLDTVLFKGRILRVKYKDKELEKMPDISKAGTSELVSLLKNKNVWLRDRAQQMLIFKQEKSAIPELEKMAMDAGNPISAIHALHTLDGLNSLTFGFIKSVASLGNPMLTAHALLLSRNFNTQSNINPMLELVNNLSNKNEATINLYLALSLNAWVKVSPDNFLPVLAKISSAYSGNPIYQEAVVSSTAGFEKELLAKINSIATEKPGSLIDSILNFTLANIKSGKMNSIYVKPVPFQDARSTGFVIYKSTCATCHGITGEGQEHIAPPLKGSAYLQGSPARLAMIILNGLEGPVNIEGKVYNFNGTMPNFGNNYSDSDIGFIVEYLHNAFVPGASKSISADEVKKLRNKKSGILTEKDLLQMEHLSDK
ncbi:MAG: c-type cytochrome, partial [Ginsengibacter sp.]